MIIVHSLAEVADMLEIERKRARDNSDVSNTNSPSAHYWNGFEEGLMKALWLLRQCELQP